MLSTIRITVGSTLLVLAAVVIGVYGLGGLMVGVPLASMGAIFLSSFLSEMASRVFLAPFRMMLGVGNGTVRKEYSEVHGAIARRDFQDALDQLNEILSDTPGEVDAELLRVQICYEHLDRIEEGLMHAFAALDTLEWNETQGRIVMLAVDMLIESRRRTDAANLLAQAGQRLINRVQRDNALTRLSTLTG